MSSSAELLREWFPHTVSPLICGAPMFGTSGGALVAALALAGGLGFIGAGYDFAPGSSQVPSLDQELATARDVLARANHAALAEGGPLPVGVGFITARPTGFFETVAPVLVRHRPVAVWLFAPAEAAVHHVMIRRIKELGAGWAIRVFVQVGTVAAAREAAGSGADVIVAQGTDAGGHQLARGAGVVSLVPEVADVLAAEFPAASARVALVAAGGIADGRGVAAALCLGAGGVAVGTRLICAAETGSTEHQRGQVLAAADGGLATVKSRAHDDIQGTAIWPDQYNGRAIRGRSWQDHETGMDPAENRRLYVEARDRAEAERRIVWAGTAVGLVAAVRPVAEIVRDMRREAASTLESVGKLQDQPPPCF